MAEVEEESKTFITEDGFILLKETGECVGAVDIPALGMLPEDLAEREKLLAEAVDTYLERRARAKARRVGLETEMNLLIAGIRERKETQIAEMDRKIKWLDTTYEAHAQEFTTIKIAGTEKKQIKRDFGTCGFRAQKGATVVDDPLLAAHQLFEAGVPDPIRVTVTLDALSSEASPQMARYIIETLSECLSTVRGENGEIEEIHALPGVAFEVMVSKLPATVPEAVTAIHINAPANPLGKFYVEHGGTK